MPRIFCSNSNLFFKLSNSKQARLRLFRFHQLGLHQFLELRDGDGVVLLELHFRDLALVEGRRVAALRLVVVVLESECQLKPRLETRFFGQNLL